MFKRLAIGCGGVVLATLGVLVLMIVVGLIAGPQSPRAPAAQAAPTATLPPATTAPAATPPVPKPAPTAVPKPATVGDTARAGNWEIQLVSAETANRVGNAPRGREAQGMFVVMTIVARNLHREPSTLNNHDFEVRSGDGTRYTPSSEGSSALLGTEPEVLLFTAQIQPGLTKRFRVVFDLNPAQSGFVLHAAEIPFRLTPP